MELAKTLLLYGEMEPLLRIASHPAIDFEKKWMFVFDCSNDLGVSELMRSTLMSYITLNVIYLHPELWDEKTRRDWVATRTRTGMVLEEKDVDYRNMKAWEQVLSRCTGRRGYDVHTYPHRLFFGVSEEMYHGQRWYRQGFGRIYNKATEAGKAADRYLPSVDDIDAVVMLFRGAGLPTEISLLILDFADFKPERRIPIPNDVFHEKNAEELRKYLSWCWKVLVRCDVLMNTTEKKIDWLYEVTDVLDRLWGSGTGHQTKGVSRYLNAEYWEEEDRTKLELQWRRIVFI